MPSYFCRSYRSIKAKFANTRTAPRRLKATLKRVSLLANAGKFKLKHKSFQPFRLLSFSKKRSNLKFNIGIVSAFPKKGKLRFTIGVGSIFPRKNNRKFAKVFAVIFRKVDGKVSRHFEIYDCLSFRSSKLTRIPEASGFYLCRRFKASKIRALTYSNNCKVWRVKSLSKKLLFLGNIGCSILQDKDYIILYKSDLSEFGLITKASNSIEEIFSSLLPLWSGETPSGQINVSFYRYFVSQETNSCFQIQSFLISLRPKLSTNTFPSPSSFI